MKTDYELVNLRINLEEAKNENSTVLQVGFREQVWNMILRELYFRSWRTLEINLQMQSNSFPAKTSWSRIWRTKYKKIPTDKTQTDK